MKPRLLARRRVLRLAPVLASALAPWHAALAARLPAGEGSGPRSRARAGDADWPSPARWEELRQRVAGALVPVRSPLSACGGARDEAACTALFKSLKNPYVLGDDRPRGSRSSTRSTARRTTTASISPR